MVFFDAWDSVVLGILLMSEISRLMDSYRRKSDAVLYSSVIVALNSYIPFCRHNFHFSLTFFITIGYKGRPVGFPVLAVACAG